MAQDTGMSKKIRAYGRTPNENGNQPFAGIIDARAVSELTRRAFEYRCLNAKCKCLHHWRRAVNGARPSYEANPPAYKRVNRTATFVKNRSSSHIPGCPYDYSRLARDYKNVRHVDGQLYLRVGFELGTDTDIDPDIPYAGLSRRYGRTAAQGYFRGFKNLQTISDFLEETFGSLSDPGVEDIILVTPKNEHIAFSQTVISERQPGRLLENSAGYARFVMAMVKPDHPLDIPHATSETIACEAVPNHHPSGPEYIRPVIAFNKKDTSSPIMVAEMIEQNRPALLAGYALPTPKDSGSGTQDVVIHLSEPDHIAALKPGNWHPRYAPVEGFDFNVPELGPANPS
mgnify:CR=1 FL=1